ncbi:MAG: hypothetical protein RLZZ605_1416 [Bacteroidota bacterium]|jgi:hypothetical protein
MNGTVIDPAKVRKLKKLAREIESLKELQTMFGVIGGLTPKQELKLNLKTEKLIKIIKGL